MCPTWNGASFSAVTPATLQASSFLSATPGPAISVATKYPIISVDIIVECIIPRALVIPSAPKLEWEDALRPRVSCVAGCGLFY